jgi:hypothetical protein
VVASTVGGRELEYRVAAILGSSSATPILAIGRFTSSGAGCGAKRLCVWVQPSWCSGGSAVGSWELESEST